MIFLWNQFIFVDHFRISGESETDFYAILKTDQKSFIAEAIDVPQMIQQSHDFRHKFDLFIRLNRIVMSSMADKSHEALDGIKQQALNFRTANMHCEQFHPIETWMWAETNLIFISNVNFA